MLRETKLEEFINLKQGNIRVNEYALKITILSKYAPSLVASPRDLMNRFMTGVSELVEEDVVWQCLLMIWISHVSWYLPSK